MRVRQISKAGIFNFGTSKMWHSMPLICRRFFVSNISFDEKKHVNKKHPTPYLEFNKILHLILFSFFEKFNTNTQVLHSSKLCGNCWSGSCAAFKCQVPREGTLKVAVIQIIRWDCPEKPQSGRYSTKTETEIVCPQGFTLLIYDSHRVRDTFLSELSQREWDNPFRTFFHH